MKKISKKISLRFVVQFSMFLLVVVLAFLHQYLGIEKMASIDAFCPFGAVESFFTLMFTGTFLKRIFTSSFILLTIFMVASLFLGRVFCGYFCPLGAMQEWLRLLGKKLGFKKDIEVPPKFDKYLRYLKYVILGLIVYFSFYLSDLIFRNYDPYVALVHFGSEFNEKIFAYLILFLIIVGSLFSKSIWCRYFCPLGAFFGITKKCGFFKIKRNPNSCVGCGKCDNYCPANLNIKDIKFVNSADCISCGKCVKDCPKSSLKYSVCSKTVSKRGYSLLVVLLVVIPLLIMPFTPIWESKAQSNIVNALGEINPADIRGSNTLSYIIEITGVPLEEFVVRLGLPEDVDLKMKLKEIGPTYDIMIGEDRLETWHFRVVVGEYSEK